MMMRLACTFVLALLASSASAGDFSNWTAVVVAGDWHAHEGGSSAAFDNGRRTIADELVGIGFSPSHVLQFSSWPQKDAAAKRQPALKQQIWDGLWRYARGAKGGCLVYFTSHGSDAGIVLGEGDLSPSELASMLANTCGGRPTAVIVSACYSGVFVPALKAPNRMVFTAAAADRSSFGCGAADKYTFFDNCVVTWLPKSGDFAKFGKDVVACVHAREKKERVDLPSHPQLAVGAEVAAFPRWK
jgi:hypothetical protein